MTDVVPPPGHETLHCSPAGQDTPASPVGPLPLEPVLLPKSPLLPPFATLPELPPPPPPVEPLPTLSNPLGLLSPPHPDAEARFATAADASSAVQIMESDIQRPAADMVVGARLGDGGAGSSRAHPAFCKSAPADVQTAELQGWQLGFFIARSRLQDARQPVRPLDPRPDPERRGSVHMWTLLGTARARAEGSALDPREPLQVRKEPRPGRHPREHLPRLRARRGEVADCVAGYRPEAGRRFVVRDRPHRHLQARTDRAPPPAARDAFGASWRAVKALDGKSRGAL